MGTPGETARPKAETTPYGMRWFPEGSQAIVGFVRVATHNGYAVARIEVTDDRGRTRYVDVTVSPKGRSLTVRLDGDKMTYAWEVE